jgi:hypothetical protein
MDDRRQQLDRVEGEGTLPAAAGWVAAPTELAPSLGFVTPGAT